jgi:hypothetical protein
MPGRRGHPVGCFTALGPVVTSGQVPITPSLLKRAIQMFSTARYGSRGESTGGDSIRGESQARPRRPTIFFNTLSSCKKSILHMHHALWRSNRRTPPPQPTPLVMDSSSTRHVALKRVLSDIGLFSERVVGRPLRPYQLEAARAIITSVLERQGRTFTVMMARQAGKNELSAHIEAFLLNLFQRVGGTLVKAAPTFRPQARISMRRLESILERGWSAGRWQALDGHRLRLGKAEAAFMSAAEGANVVGATADILLEIDEAQDVPEARYDRDFRPMGATANVTTVLYGTAWTSDTLLERLRRQHQAMEADGLGRLHFEYDWQAVAQHNLDYGRYVQAEIDRLGADHPLIRTQYLLQPLNGSGGFFSEAQLALLSGQHGRQRVPSAGTQYVAGIDLAGADEQIDDELLVTPLARRDSTVLTICAVRWQSVAGLVPEPWMEVVDHIQWTNMPHRALYERLLGLVRDHWHCQRVVVDATGVGAGIAGFLVSALGRQVVEPFQFTTASKSELGYALLGSINGSRLRVYVDDGSAEWRELWSQARAARYGLGAGQRLSFFVPPSAGHDDYIMSLALAVRAAALGAPRRASARAASAI